MAFICTIEENSKPVAVVSAFNNLLLPGALAGAVQKGEWLWSALTKKPAPWDGKSPITGRASTSREFGLYESNVQQAAKHGHVDKDHHVAILNVEPAPATPPKAVTRWRSPEEG